MRIKNQLKIFYDSIKKSSYFNTHAYISEVVTYYYNESGFNKVTRSNNTELRIDNKNTKEWNVKPISYSNPI